MAHRGKKYRAVSEKIGAGRVFGLGEAVSFLRENSYCKFDETVEVAIDLNVDPKAADQNVRGVVPLPAGTGKVIKIAVFAKGKSADDALSAGADYVGADDLVEKISSGNLDLDVCIATPDMMGVVGRLGKILGPKGLMPNPKLGTVTPNVAVAVKNARAGQVEYRLDKGGVIHAGLGKLSFDQGKIEENVKVFVGAVLKARPAGVKGSFLKSVVLSSTMGPGLLLNSTEAMEF
ncbi:MAG: 50S ribosomal protein L1 [Holosporaceae bacterium]|jgi:large subunit ribosomal protein L1|nr:50S ribosomal protein L1 [Holosporaceae bacterium]